MNIFSKNHKNIFNVPNFQGKNNEKSFVELE